MRVSKLQTNIVLFNLHSEYLTLSHFVRDLLPLKSLTKEVIDNLGIDSENLEFVSRTTVYEENNGAMVLIESPNINPKSKHSYVKYNWFTQHIGKEFVIR